LIQECIDLKISDTVMTSQKGINSEIEGASARRVLNIPSKKVSVSPHTQEPSSSHAAASTFKVCARKRNLLIAHNTFGQIKMEIPWYNSRHTLISRKRMANQE